LKVWGIWFPAWFSVSFSDREVIFAGGVNPSLTPLTLATLSATSLDLSVLDASSIFATGTIGSVVPKVFWGRSAPHSGLRRAVGLDRAARGIELRPRLERASLPAGALLLHDLGHSARSCAHYGGDQHHVSVRIIALEGGMGIEEGGRGRCRPGPVLLNPEGDRTLRKSTQWPSG